MSDLNEPIMIPASRGQIRRMSQEAAERQLWLSLGVVGALLTATLLTAAVGIFA